MRGFRSRKLATIAAVAALASGASACATAEDEALLWQALGLAADIAIYDAMLDNCSFYTSTYGSTLTYCGDRDDDHDHRHRGGHRGGDRGDRGDRDD